MRRLLAFSVCPALLFAACNRQSDPPSVTNGVIVIDTAQSLRHDLSLTPATRHHLASLGFSYGVQAERGRWTGDTNSLSFTEERLRAVVDGLGRDDAAPWGPRPPAVGREDASDVERVSEEP